MENIDWLQFRTLALILAGCYCVFEIIRLAVQQTIKVFGGREREQSLYLATNTFSILRVIIIAAFFIIFFFTAIFNRTEIAVPHSDVGHRENVQNLEKVDTETLQTTIKNSEQRLKDKSLREVNSESEKEYEEFLQQNAVHN